MTKTNDGGPAFPKNLQFSGMGYCANISAELTGGMSLRDWFAGQALCGIMGNSEHRDPLDNTESGCRVAAEHAYKVADAMIAERSKQS